MLTLDNRIDAFWKWIEHNSLVLRTEVRRASDTRDLETLDALVSSIYEQAAEISEQLLVDIHVSSEDLLLAVRGGPADRMLVAQVLARAPALSGWRFAAEVPRDLERIIVRDETGRELMVPYAALSFVLSGKLPSGRRTLLIVFDGDFEPGGADHHLFNAVADQVVLTLLGRIPASDCTHALVPARMARGAITRPILELEAAWANVG